MSRACTVGCIVVLVASGWCSGRYADGITAGTGAEPCEEVAAPPPVPATSADDLALVRADEDRRTAVLAAVAPAVVCLFADPHAQSGGSGVIIDPAGFGLTNFHVVAGMLETRRGFAGLSDGRLYPVQILGIDPGGDLAMFKIEGKPRFDFAPLGDSETLQVGQWVAALGNPFLLAEDFVPTITIGVISGLHRYQYGQGNLLEYADCIQVSTSINPGNSGGPVVDFAGRVIGIAGRASFEERGRVNVGLGYAIPTVQVRRFLPALRAGRLCQHGTLGATVRLAGDDLIFDAIQDFSPADRAGVELGDVLLSVNGCPMRTANDYNNAITALPAGWPVTLEIRRAGDQRTIRARLEPLVPHDIPLFVPDLALNHAEIRRYFPEHAESDHGQPQREQPGHEESGRGPAAHESPVSVPALPPELETEWRALAAPFRAPPELDVSWEHLGADEVDGRLAAVIEHRPDAARRVRWRFDFDTAALLEVSFGTPEEPEQVVWRPVLHDARRLTRSTNGQTAEFVVGHSVGLPWPHAETPASLQSQPAGPETACKPGPGQATALTADGPPLPATLIQHAQERVVKLYGAAFGAAKAYGSGVLVSPDGRIVTALSVMLEGESLRATLHDGRTLPAAVLARDERRQLALLKVPAAGLPCFDLNATGPAVSRLQQADRLLAAANPFKVADGPEPVSITIGAFAGRAPLAARARTRELEYAGPVLLADMITTTPGSAGGAVLDSRGALVGVIGPAVISARTNTWLNYAIYADEVARFVAEADGREAPSPELAGLTEAAHPGKIAPAPGRSAADEPNRGRANEPGRDAAALSAGGTPDDPGRAAGAFEFPAAAAIRLGLILFDVGGRTRPAYIERVRPNSAAQTAGLRADDLILVLNEQPVPDCTGFYDLAARLQPGDRASLVIKRGQEIVLCDLTVLPREGLGGGSPGGTP